MNHPQPAEVVQLLRRIEPRLAAYEIEAELGDDLWELGFEQAGRSHRLKIDRLYFETCLAGDCEHIRAIVKEVCDYLEGR